MRGPPLSVRPAPVGAFVSWIPHHGRSQGFIDALNLEPIYTSYLGMERPMLAPLKYGPQFVATLRWLKRVRPQVVLVMDPPPVAVAAVYAYCRRTGARYAMDCHSGVFEGARWRWSLPMQRFFGRRAAAVIVTNPVHFETATAWPAKAIIVGDPPPALGQVSALSAFRPSSSEAEIFVIVRFGRDEAVAEILEAARRRPNVHFSVSGDTRRAHPDWLASRPPNVTFTGWLPAGDFWTRVRRSSAILTLTTQENTILRGGWEAMFTGQPLITSRSRALRDYFNRGAVFVDNTPDGIAAGVDQALSWQDDLRREMSALRVERYATWHQERHRLGELLGIEFADPAEVTGTG